MKKQIVSLLALTLTLNMYSLAYAEAGDAKAFFGNISGKIVEGFEKNTEKKYNCK